MILAALSAGFLASCSQAGASTHPATERPAASASSLVSLVPVPPGQPTTASTTPRPPKVAVVGATPVTNAAPTETTAPPGTAPATTPSQP